MEIQILIETKILKINTFLTLKLLDAVFIMLLNVKMSTIDGILILMRMINFMLSCVEHGIF